MVRGCPDVLMALTGPPDGATDHGWDHGATCPCDGTCPECVVPLIMFMMGPLLSEAAVVDLKALQSLYLACGSSCTPVPYWDKLQAGCRPAALPSIPSFGSPGDLAMDHGQSMLCQLSPSEV